MMGKGLGPGGVIKLLRLTDNSPAPSSEEGSEVQLRLPALPLVWLRMKRRSMMVRERRTETERTFRTQDPEAPGGDPYLRKSCLLAGRI